MPNIETGAHPVSVNNPQLNYGRVSPNVTVPTDDRYSGVWNFDYPSEANSPLYQTARTRSLLNQNRLHVEETEKRKQEERLRKIAHGIVRLAAGALAFGAYQAVAQQHNQPQLSDLGNASYMMALSPDLAHLFGVSHLPVQQNGSTCYIDLGIFGGCMGFNAGDYTIAAGGVFCRGNGEWNQNMTGEYLKYDSDCRLLPGYPRFEPVPGATPTGAQFVPETAPTVQPTFVPDVRPEQGATDGVYRHNGNAVSAYIPGRGNQFLMNFDFNGYRYTGDNSIPYGEQASGLLMYIKRNDGGPTAYLICTNGHADWSTNPPVSKTRILPGLTSSTYCLPSDTTPTVATPTAQPKAPDPTKVPEPAAPVFDEFTLKDTVTGEYAFVIGLDGRTIPLKWPHRTDILGLAYDLLTSKAAALGSVFSSMGPNSHGSDGQPIRISVTRRDGYIFVSATQMVHLVNPDPMRGLAGHKQEWVDLPDTVNVYCTKQSDGSWSVGFSRNMRLVLYPAPMPFGASFGYFDASMQGSRYPVTRSSDGTSMVEPGFGWTTNANAERGCPEDLRGK
ncbi:MAG: hypothetical protein WC775_04705 [Patescibacteria group bacterium]